MRLADLDALKDAINFGISDAPTYIKATVDQYIDEAPIIDAVPVVRCRECRHYKPEEYFSPCTLPQGLECAKPDDFCSYGQRKEAEHDNCWEWRGPDEE